MEVMNLCSSAASNHIKGTKPCKFVLSLLSPQPKLYSNEGVPHALELAIFTLVFGH